MPKLENLGILVDSSDVKVEAALNFVRWTYLMPWEAEALVEITGFFCQLKGDTVPFDHQIKKLWISYSEMCRIFYLLLLI